MKKLQKLALALVATSSLLSPSAFASEDQVYVTVGGGALFGTKLTKNFQVDGYTTILSLKAPKTGAELFLGVGYNATEQIRGELVFVSPWFGKSKVNWTDSSSVAQTGHISAQVYALQVRGYFDAFDISGMGKAYVGAGFGSSMIKQKLSITGVTKESKLQSSFSWMVGLGAAFDVADNVKLGLEYNYQDFGRYKYSDVKKNFKYTGQAVLAKLVFKI